MIKIKLNNYFDIDSTITCGQIFRYEKLDDCSYDVILKDRVINIKIEDNNLVVESNNYDNLENIIIDYFDLNRNYDSINNILKKDKQIVELVNFNKGLKMIKFNPLECVISYVISQNNGVPQITNSLNLISKNYGEKIIFKNKEYYLFPNLDSLSKLTEQDFRNCKVGFRDKYLVSVIKNIKNNELDLNKIFEMNSIDALNYLQLNKGIGIKVASCILLFAYHKFDVYPIDTWVIKYMSENYNINDKKEIEIYFKNNFNEYSAIIIQYIFNYNRNK